VTIQHAGNWHHATKAYSPNNIDLTTSSDRHQSCNMSQTTRPTIAAVVAVPLETMSFHSCQTHQETQKTSESNALRRALTTCFHARNHQSAIESSSSSNWPPQPERIRVGCQTSCVEEHLSSRWSRSLDCWLHKTQITVTELQKPWRWQRSEVH
jgi:hypothetical protein